MLHYEDFIVGETVSFGAYEVTAAEITAYATMYDPSALELAGDGKAVASAWHVCAIMMRMMCDGFILNATSMGAPGVEHLEWTDPVRSGDVLSMRRTVLAARRSKSRPGVGLVRFRFDVLDQTGTLKLSCENWVLLGARNQGAA